MQARRMAKTMLVGMLLAGSALLRAQEAGRYEASATFLVQHSNRANSSQSTTLYGGSGEFAAELHKGWGVGARFTGATTSSVGQSGVPLTLVTVDFGPRYRSPMGKRAAVYGEALAGFAHGFDSVFPGSSSVVSSASSYAIELNGGVDLKLTHHVAWRLLDAGWLHTALPNATNNHQDNFHVGTGLAFHFGK